MSQSVDRKICIFGSLCALLLLTIALLFFYGLPELNELKRGIVNDYSDQNMFTNHQNMRYSGNQSDNSVHLSKLWQKADLNRDEIPYSVSELVSKINVKSNRITINDCEIFYLEVNPENASKQLSVLLLHGMSFTSKTWQELETIQTVSALGYRTVAIDLPGFGNSCQNNAIDSDQYRSQFLYNTIEKLRMKSPVIISPSFSGRFSLPFLLEHWNIMAGYVPVSPVGNELLLKYKCSQHTNRIEIEQRLAKLPEKLKKDLKPPYPDLSCVQVPTMVVYGENDNNRYGLQSSAYLSLLPLSVIIEIPNGSHAAYLSNKQLWHKLLYNFLRLISRKTI